MIANDNEVYDRALQLHDHGRRADGENRELGPQLPPRQFAGRDSRCALKKVRGGH